MKTCGQEYSDKYETNPISEGYHSEDCNEIHFEDLVDMIREKNHVIKSERIRFVTDSGYPLVDLSYWHVRIDGERFRVEGSPFERLSKHNHKQSMYEAIKSEKVFIPNLFNDYSLLR